MSETFGARSVHEIRRLSNSTWGLGYKELHLADGMDRDVSLETFATRLIPFGADWLESRRQLTAEDLARAVIREGEARAKSAGTRWDPFDLLVDILDGFS